MPTQVIAQFLLKYVLPLLAMIALVAGIYFTGAHSVQVKWDKEKAERKTQVEIQRVVQDKITYLTNTEYVYKTKEIKVKGDTIIKEVPVYVTKEDDAACRINNGSIRVLDSAVRNEIPGPTDESDRADAGVSLSDVVENTAGNYTTCNIYKERAIAWEKWAKEQKAASEAQK